MSDEDGTRDVDRVRRDAAEQAWTVERVVREIENVDMHERAIRDMCRAAKGEVVPRLLDAMRTREGAAKENASILLLHLGDVRGTEGIIELLVDGDDDTRVGLLAHLSVLPSREPTGAWAHIMEP